VGCVSLLGVALVAVPGKMVIPRTPKASCAWRRQLQLSMSLQSQLGANHTGKQQAWINLQLWLHLTLCARAPPCTSWSTTWRNIF
jgi:hypothetical protein